MVPTLQTTPEFDLLHEMYGAEEGRSPFLECADGTVQRRVVRACRIASPAALEYACRQLMPSGEDEHFQAHTLRELYARDGQALVYVEATYPRRAKVVFSNLRVGVEAQVLGVGSKRSLVIERLRELSAFYQ